MVIFFFTWYHNLHINLTIYVIICILIGSCTEGGVVFVWIKYFLICVFYNTGLIKYILIICDFFLVILIVAGAVPHIDI